MKVSLVALSLTCSLILGCRCDAPPRIEPPLPSSVAGWKDHREFGVHVLGEFVLRKNETTDNGKVQFRLIDVVPGEPCVDGGPQAHNARVVLQVISPSDGKVLCEDTFLEKGSTTLSAECRSHPVVFGLLSIEVNAINIKDGWVHFKVLG